MASRLLTTNAISRARDSATLIRFSSYRNGTSPGVSASRPIGRSGIEFALADAGQHLHALAEVIVGPLGPCPARRCRFELDGAPLVVHEIFLPALEDSLATVQRARRA